jgi:acetate kinase
MNTATICRKSAIGSGRPEPMRILVVNGGSSSFKCRLDEVGAGPLPTEPPKPAWEAHIDLEPGERLSGTLDRTLNSVPGKVDIVGHRIVHGGPKYRTPVFLALEVRATIALEAEVAPTHNRFELAAIDAVDRVFGTQARQAAVFDAGFHTTLEPPAYVYPGPYDWLSEGIRRYGFHGISHQYASRRAAEILGRESLRLIVCHLGNGASLAAVRDGKSVDTTMGFTPLEGLMMGTRCGSIDPAIVVYLQRHRGYSADQLDGILNRESGLLGVSGVSGDMREILAAIEQGNPRAKLAFDIYAHRLCREIGAMAAVLGSVDAIAFTGGVGENCAPLRERVLNQIKFLKDAQVLVIHSEEEWEIARECQRLAKA